MITLQDFLKDHHCLLSPTQTPVEAEQMWEQMLPDDPDSLMKSVEMQQAFLRILIENGIAVEESVRNSKREGMDFIYYRMQNGDDLPPHVREWAERNLAVLEDSSRNETEIMHARQALSLLLRVDWSYHPLTSLDVVEAKARLDKELYGLESVKQRVLETLIQVNRTHTVPAYGILLVGPAGVGKSQLAHAMADILNMPWASLDMSTISTVETSTGTPRLYMNARPGAVMQAICDAGSPNVMFLLNELDKAGNAQNGNPSMALLSLLDHLGFMDQYLECPIATEGIYSVATANDADKIDPSVLSRFTTIELQDYTPEEKVVIFQEYALPKVLAKLRMSAEECIVKPDAVEAIVEKYKDRTGARELEQEAEHLASHALYRIETEGIKTLSYSADDLPDN
ncbi:MAG: AAA family ATPase [Clostridia bacterium]|nr:AAA family ATPase [Clostridia bacterium]